MGEYVDVRIYGEAAEILADWKAHRDEWDRLKVLADFYEENGRPHDAFCYRWMACYKQRPLFRMIYARQVRGQYSVRKVPDKYSWGWYTIGTAGIEAYACLPPVVFRGINSGAHKYYPSEEAAIFDLARALATLNEVLSLKERKQ